MASKARETSEALGQATFALRALYLYVNSKEYNEASTSS